MTLTINVIDREGNNHTIEAFEGQPIAQAISQHIKPNEFIKKVPSFSSVLINQLEFCIGKNKSYKISS